MFRTVLLVGLASAAPAAAQPVPFPLLPGEECPAPAPPLDPVLAWNDMARGAIRADKTPPPVAARHLAVVHVAAYDAVAAVLVYPPFRVRDAADGSAVAAAAAAAHRVLSAIYPKYAASFDAELAASLAGVPDRAARDAGVAVGRRVADRVLAWRANDLTPGASDYALRPDVGRWRPTPPGYADPLLPRWAKLPFFALSDAAAARPPGPPTLASPAFAVSYHEVKAIGAARSPTRTREQTEIAHFWEDGTGTVTPPGHWNRIARTVAARKGLTLAENARLFAALNVALADVAIACWECKFRFDVWRPVTAIRSAGRLGDPALAPDPGWEPLLPTPPFPAYTSGHSSFSGAAAAVLAAAFGSDSVRFESTSDGLPGVVRSFRSFSAAANEAGLSRIYGGIHWDFDNRDGLAGGRRIGEYVAKHFYRPADRHPDRAAPAGLAIRGRPASEPVIPSGPGGPDR